MLVSSCYLNVTYYMRQHFFESEPKTQQIQAASGLEEDGIDLHYPGNGTWHNKHPQTACRLCKPNPMFNAYGPLSLFVHSFFKLCNMDPAITNLPVWSQTTRTQGPKKSEETVCLCSQADGNTPEVNLMEIEGLESWAPRFLVDAKAILHIYLHPHKAASNASTMSHCHIITLKNNHSPEITRMILLHRQKHSQCSRKLHV